MDYLPINLCKMDKMSVIQLNPLVLAYIGDSVQQLAVRVKLCYNSTAKAGELHKQATNEIKASNQAKLMDKIMPQLTEEEMSVFKRARNSKMNTMAKNATSADYKKASGYEAIIGYLYLLGEHDRLEKLLNLSLEDGDGTSFS